MDQLGIEVGLGPGYIVLDWDPAPLPKKQSNLNKNVWRLRYTSWALDLAGGSYTCSSIKPQGREVRGCE